MDGEELARSIFLNAGCRECAPAKIVGRLIQDGGRMEGVVLNIALCVNGDGPDLEATRGRAPLHVIEVLAGQVRDRGGHAFDRRDECRRVVRRTGLCRFHHQHKSGNFKRLQQIALRIHYRVSAIAVDGVRHRAGISVGVICVVDGAGCGVDGDG